MKVSQVNHSVINLLRYLSDDGELIIKKRPHIKITGNFQGKKRVVTLCHSPTERYYEHEIRSIIRRFIEPMDLDEKTIKKINKKFMQI